VDWTESRGTGVIYSYSVTRRGAGAPFCMAYVHLDEGPTMMTNIVDVDLDTVRIGQRVKSGTYSGGRGHRIRSTSAHISGS